MKKVFFILLITVFYSCKEDKCLKNTGKIAVEKRPFSAINQLIIDRFVPVFLIQDSVNYIELEAGKNILKHIKTEITDSTLTISDDNTCNWLRNYDKTKKITIHLKSELSYLKQNSSSDIISLNQLKTSYLNIEQLGDGKIDLDILAETINLKIDSNSDFILKGKVNNFNCHIKYISLFDTENTIINNLAIEYYSELNGKANVINELNATIYSVGNLEVKGNPKSVKITEVKSGKVLLN